MFHLYTSEGIRHDESLESLSRRLSGMKIDRKGKARKTLSRQKEGRGDIHLQKALKSYHQSLQEKEERGTIIHVYEIMSSPVVTLQSNMTIGGVRKKFSHHEVEHLVVLGRGEEIAGIVTFLDVCKYLADNSEAETLPVSEIMSSPVITVSSLTDIRRAALVLFDQHMSSLPVIDHNKKLVGIITRSDILHALVSAWSFTVTV
jgi:CBS-domain-containing membrane protein